MDYATLHINHRNTILAALRYWQVLLRDGKPAAGDELKAIVEIAGEGWDCATPEDVGDMCEDLNVLAPEATEHDRLRLNTSLAALRCWEHFQTTWEPPTGSRLDAIYDIAGDKSHVATVDEIEALCEELEKLAAQPPSP